MRIRLISVPGLKSGAISCGLLCSFAVTPASFAKDRQSQTERPVEQIIVTALKRAESLSNLPAAAYVLNEDQIRQSSVRDISALSGELPSLRVATFANSSATNFIIRGYGNGAFSPGIEPSVGVYIDNVYRSRAGAAIADFPQVESIEVLRGPQSSTYGKNAVAGIISIMTPKPSFSVGGYAEVESANFGGFAVRAKLTGPIAESVAVSGEAGLRRRSGYGKISNLDEYINDRNRVWARGQALIAPQPNFSVRLIADYDLTREACCLVTNVQSGPTTSLIEAMGGHIDRDAPYSAHTFLNRNSQNRIANFGLSAHADVDLGEWKLTSITSARSSKTKQSQDSDFSSADILGRNEERRKVETFTQELRVQWQLHPDASVLLGWFHLNESVAQRNHLAFGENFRSYADGLIQARSGGALGASVLEALASGEGYPGQFWQSGQGTDEHYRLHNVTDTIFGALELKFLDRARLSLGASFTDDRKSARAHVESTDSFSAVDLVAVGAGLIRNSVVTTKVGELIGVGRSATPAEVAQFAAENPNAYSQIYSAAKLIGAQLSSSPANPLLPLRSLQILPPFLAFPNAVESGKIHDRKLSWSARLSYSLADRILAYVGYGTGFKPSSINLSRDSRPASSDLIEGSPAQSPSPEASPIRDAGLALTNLTSGSRFAGPEKAVSIEAGLRGTWHNGRASIVVFRQSVTGFQTTLFTGTSFVLVNAGKQSTRGVEFEGYYDATERLRLSLAASCLNAKYDKFLAGVDASGTVADYSGKRVGGVSKFTASVGVDLAQTVGQEEIGFSARYIYESPVQIRNDVPMIKRQVKMLNAALTWRPWPGSEITLWSRNLLQDRWLVQVFPAVLQPGTLSGYPNEPRTYGLRMKADF